MRSKILQEILDNTSSDVYTELRTKLNNMELINKYISDPNILNIYPLGSRVYKTHTEKSDHDLILVCKNFFESNNIDVHVYTESAFELALRNHDIQILECIFLPKELIYKETNNYSLELDKLKLRPAISTISNNSYVKAKKKLIISGDYDLNLALKSFFHSYRIIDFGIQIASEGKITNYSSCNWLLEDLYKMSNDAQRDQLWSNIETKYKEKWNKHASLFKSLCPKDNNKNIQIEKINTLFQDNNLNIIKHKKLIQEIYNIFK